VTVTDAIAEFRVRVDGTPQSWTRCRLATTRITRSIGLSADRAVIIVDREDWPDDFDPRGLVDIRFGDDGDPLTLGGYVVDRVDPGAIGERLGESSDSVQEWVVSLITRTGLYLDGRGGLITEGVFNSLTDENIPDDEADDYKSIQELAQIAVDAIGVEGTAPSGLNTSVDGSTPIRPPAPVDWGNARAAPELEDLMRYAGWSVTLSLDGSEILFAPLLRGGQTVTIPGGVLATAEPYELSRGPGARGSTIVVTSGRTRTTVVVGLDLSKFEWVGYDERTGAWLNGTEWAAAYPDPGGDDPKTDAAVPGSLSVFQAGPNNPDIGDTPGEQRKAFSRIYGALRLIEDEKARAGFVSLSQTVDGDPSAGRPALGRSGAVYQGDAQVYNPSGGWDSFDDDTVFGLIPISEEGVFRLPPQYVFIASGASYYNAAELSGEDGQVVFAHEARTGEFVDDYFVRAFTVSATGGEISATELVDADLDNAIADPMSVKIEAPFLRRLVGEDDVGEWTEANDTELTEIAKELALLRGADEAIEYGVVPLRGLQPIEPGSYGGAVTSVTFDASRRRTELEINGHEAPSSEYQLLESLARRSLANGIQRFNLPGSSVAESDVRAGGTPTGAGGSADPNKVGGATSQTSSPRRGRHRAEPADASVTETALAASSQIPFAAQRMMLAVVESESGNQSYECREIVNIGTTGLSTGVGRTVTATNLAEAGFDSETVKGNGVSEDNLPDGFDFTRVPAGRTVLLQLVGDNWVFDAVTVPDGACPEAET
jgi:hypothetical protein